MVGEIRIYVEGGGDSKDTKAFFRQGFSAFLHALRSEARRRKVRWSIIACGPRQRAFEDFKIAGREHPTAFNVLLVDSESPVLSPPWQHLGERDGWDIRGLSNDRCHLMVQAMEAWFIADIETLSQYYGQGFNANPIPASQNVENTGKEVLNRSLKEATRNTSKGEYHKGRHAYKLLELIDPIIVRHASQHCDRLFVTIAEKMQEEI
ncbi:MAG: DUF4276 family protein [Candidatus Korobacteraceae bacterium]